ncbi:MAG TPA: alpha-amylase family glycosyl hydrolase [Acidisarcina sp.]
MERLVWWQSGIIYQIYPRSFQDSNGDGVGDLRGIMQRLEHLVSLGIDAVWISPIYPSPMADFGYDVSDYCNIDPIFGTLADFDELAALIHARGLRLILDFVPNHTSSEHPWFLESRSSRSNPKRDWYIWLDPSSDGGPPNNWTSQFGGSAWELDLTTGQYYLHSFLKQQPDLNWRNREVSEAMLNALRFWLDRGVDGFRVDVMWLLIKDDQFRNNPSNPGYQPGAPDNQKLLSVYNSNRPETLDIVRQMRAVLDSYPERLLIGEIYLPTLELVTYYGPELDGANLPFNFQLMQTAWAAEPLRKMIAEYLSAIPRGGWPDWVLGNHDQSRIATRIGSAQARVAAMLLLTLWGTPTIYYGEEIGMTDVPIAPEEVQDPAEKNQPGLGQGRDPERTPMPWDSSPGAGFTTGRPWLRLDSDFQVTNVSAISAEPHSILNLYRALIALRRNSAALTGGSTEALAADGDVLSYQRISGEEHLAIYLNTRHDPQQITTRAGRVLLSTYMDREESIEGDILKLRPAEGVIVALD